MTSISNDSIYFQLSKNVTDKRKYLKDLKKNYSNDAYSADIIDGYTRSELFDLINKGVIVGEDKAKN